MDTGRISHFFVRVFLAHLATSGIAAGAEGPKFGLPVDCRPGKNCWIVNYFDNDPGIGVRDYACGYRSYDGHGGTDFGIRDLAVMSQGVRVLAAAPGIVRRVRDGVSDIAVNESNRHAVEGRECGNGVVIDHTGGWTTQYCHLRRGSLVVSAGDQVNTGQTLGLIGLSGLTEFPHVEFTVRYRGRKIDPFVGLQGSATCAVSKTRLWDDTALAGLEYRPLIIFNAGFSDAIPRQDEVRRGQHHQSAIAVDAPAVMFWVELLGVRAGDRLRLHVQAPDGDTVVEHGRTLERTQAYRFEFAGKRRRNQNWTPGRYIG
ncbi:MAG: M23 family metallopeptidase, partial [Rhodospirillales bacterium]